MKIAVGLGNPGDQYQRTRHNAGFMVLEAYAQRFSPDSEWRESSKFLARLNETAKALLVEPQTYMNDSGKAAQAVTHFYKITDLSNLFVVHDDLDLPLGSYKIQLATGPKIHNGLLSMYQLLGSKEFWHVRIGVDSRQGDRTLPGQAYVLQTFSAEESTLFDQMLAKLLPELDHVWQI